MNLSRRIINLFAAVTLNLNSIPILLAQDAVEIIKKVEEMLGPKNLKASYRFVNHRLDGTTSEYQVNFSMRDAERSHVQFIFPEREKGREVLRLDNDIWSFVPGVSRVVRIADRDSFAGGDFSNADVLRIDWLKKYVPKVLKDLPNQWIIQMDAKPATSAPYAKMRLWVDKKTGQPVQQHYYDSNGTLLKRCLYGETKKFAVIERPARLVMENVITKQKSELTVLDFQMIAGFPDSRFMVENLGK